MARSTLPDGDGALLVDDLRRAVEQRAGTTLVVEPAATGFTVRDVTATGDGALRSVVRCTPATMTFTLEDRVWSGTGGVAVGGFRGQVLGTPAHAVVRAAAAETGWQERTPVSVLVAKVTAGVAVGGLALGGVVVAVLALTGNLPS